MKMGDGGFRPAYNPQLASDVDSLVIVGVEVATVGSDQGQMVPMIEQVRERCGQAPEAWLVDGGFVGHQQVEQASAHTTVYGPVPAAKVKPRSAVTPERRRHSGAVDRSETEWLALGYSVPIDQEGC